MNVVPVQFRQTLEETVMNSVCKAAVALGLASLLGASEAPADDMGFEVSVGALSSRMDDLFGGPDFGDLTRVSDHATGWSLSGAWRFNPNFALDLEYADHGTFHGFNICPPELLCIAADSPEQVEGTTWTLSMLGDLPLSDSWSLVGRLGWAETELDRRSASDVDVDGVAAGVGLRWSYNDMSSLLLEYRVEAAELERLGLQWNYRF